MINNIAKTTICLLTAMLLPIVSWAGGYTTKIDENGKTYVVENPGRVSNTITCGDIKAVLSLSELAGQKPNIMVVLITITGDDTTRTMPKRLISEFDDYIEDYHTLNNFKVGCLTGDGGIGMVFQSSDPNMDASYIQLDKYGRLFSKFNQTGYVLQTLQP